MTDGYGDDAGGGPGGGGNYPWRKGMWSSNKEHLCGFRAELPG